MTRIEALKDLLTKVEAGDIPVNSWRSFAPLAGGGGVYVDPQAQTAMRAYNGSLDAAKALHEALLPEWRLIVSQFEAGHWHVKLYRPMEEDWPKWTPYPYVEAVNDSEAMARLIAILKALIAEAGK